MSVLIDFGEPGDYTLTARTANGRSIGSTDISRDAAGGYTATVTIDGNHGLHHGDEIALTLTDSSGATVAEADGVVDNPDACTPETPSMTTGNGNTQPGNLVKNNNAPAASPVSGNPSYTG